MVGKFCMWSLTKDFTELYMNAHPLLQVGLGFVQRSVKPDHVQ